MKLSKFIDHTILKPNATKQDVIAICEDAKKYDFMSVCIHPIYIELAKECLKDCDVKVCSVVGFPLGTNTTASKEFETKDAISRGADEVDMVLNVGALKDKDYEYVKNDVAAVVNAANGNVVKVILETFYLTDAEKTIATRLCCEAGVSFVKTCTGFNAGIASVEDVKIMKAACTAGVKVKAAGGIRTKGSAMALIDAGAERLGTSAGVAIIG